MDARASPASPGAAGFETTQRPAPVFGVASLAALVGAGCTTAPGVMFDSDTEVHEWPPPPDEARIRYVGALRTADDLKPGQTSVTVHPGELVHVLYRVSNERNQPVTGQAIPSYGPQLAAAHFKKLECFCFARQTLGGAVTFGYALVQPWLRIGVTGTVQHDSIDTQQVNTFFGSTSGFVSVFQRLPLANLFSAGRTVSLRPAITYDTRNNRLFPSSGLYLQASTELASSALGSELEFLRHELIGRFYYPLFGQGEQPGSGFIIKMNNKVGVITSPLCC